MQADAGSVLAAPLGITTPIGDFSIPETGTAPIVAIVSTRIGVIAADTSPGAVVRGGGSTTVRISGTPAQVNSKLASLTYAATVAGLDQLSILVLDAAGTLSPVLQTAIAIIPLAGAPDPASRLVYVDRGTLTLEARTFDGPDLLVRALDGGQSATTCILINSTIGADSHLTLDNDNAPGGVMPRLAIAGRVALDGMTAFTGGTAVSIARSAILRNAGSMTIDAHATRFTGAGTLANDGLILITGDGAAGAPVRIDTTLEGSGTVSLTAGASLDIGGSVADGETISLGAGANTLRLAQPGAFAGQIAGFSDGDTLVLDGVTVTAAYFSRAGETGSGVLSLFDGTLAVGAIRFNTPEAGTIFQLGADAAGSPTIRLDRPTTPRGTVDVYRFFDAANGTQLLTQDRTERDSILGSRPDLQFEGVGLHAVDPAHPDPDAAAVYRFFERANGTHFLTASAIERDAILDSRPDLVFEPSSTMFEHSTAQPGDTAVYRFFDNSKGAHFFTADAGERATIAATRPDMSFEGIAFYAPSA